MPEDDDRIRQFDSFDDLLAYLAEQRAIADSRVQSWQRNIDYEDCFVQDIGEGFPIFMTVERSPYPEDADVENGMFFMDRRPVRAWSWMCPEGELGTAHVSTVFARMSPPAWVLCKQAGWPRKIGATFCLSYEQDGDELVPWVRLTSEMKQATAEA
jgi:hypothetical protein